MLRCENCSMTFETRTLLKRHVQKFCDRAGTPVLVGRSRVEELEEMKRTRQQLRRLQDREEKGLLSRMRSTADDINSSQRELEAKVGSRGLYGVTDAVRNIKSRLSDARSNRERAFSEVDRIESRINGGAISRNVFSESELTYPDQNRWKRSNNLLAPAPRTSSYNISQIQDQKRELEEQNASIQRKLRQVHEEQYSDYPSFRHVHQPLPPSPRECRRRPDCLKPPLHPDSRRLDYTSDNSRHRALKSLLRRERPPVAPPTYHHQPIRSDSSCSGCCDDSDCDWMSPNLHILPPKPAPRRKRRVQEYRGSDTEGGVNELISLVKNQERRNEEMLGDLRQQVDRLTSQQQRVQPPPPIRNPRLRRINTSGDQTEELLDEIAGLKQEYIQTGGTDENVMDEMNHLLSETLALDRIQQKNKWKSKKKDKSGVDMKAELALEEMKRENDRLSNQLSQFQQSNFNQSAARSGFGTSNWNPSYY